MTKTYIVANWKMHFNTGQASLYLNTLSQQIKSSRNLEIILAPSMVSLQPLSLQINHRKFKLSAQNFYHKDLGAYTGEVSISQLRGLVDYALVGHSERRFLFNETDRDIRQKVSSAIRNNIRPILCIGETASEKTFGETTSVIKDQLIGGLIDVSVEDIPKVLIAYEPVWAISSTSGATPAPVSDIENSIKIIRDELNTLYGEQISEEVAILYGGSVNPLNADDYLSVKGCNGLLVGSASLKSEDFISIIETTKRMI